MSIATLDPPIVYDIPVRESVRAPVPEQEQRLAIVCCYLCGEASVLKCELCEQAVCKACYREDYGPCLIESDWCLPCANWKAERRNAAYAGYRAKDGHEPAPISTKQNRFLSSRFA